MTTKAYLESVRTLEGRMVRTPIPQPAAVQTPGYSPTVYSIRYDEGDRSYAVVLEGLTHRP